MITIEIQEEVNTHTDMKYLLEEIIRQIDNGVTRGYYPHWELIGEEEPENEEA